MGNINIGIMEKKMETTIMGLYKDYRVYIYVAQSQQGEYMGIMEKKRETIGIIGFTVGVMLGLHWGYIEVIFVAQTIPARGACCASMLPPRQKLPRRLGARTGARELRFWP